MTAGFKDFLLTFQYVQSPRGIEQLKDSGQSSELECSVPFRGNSPHFQCLADGRVCPQAMLRSSQPLTGTNGRRCKEDEKLINATLRSGRRGFVIDTRPLPVAQQARAKGGGFEQEVHYPQWRRIHKYIERSVKSGSPLSSAVSEQ